MIDFAVFICNNHTNCSYYEENVSSNGLCKYCIPNTGERVECTNAHAQLDFVSKHLKQVMKEKHSIRTKKGLEKRKKAGMHVGRPHGAFTDVSKLKLYKHREDIKGNLFVGLSLKTIADNLNCQVSTLKNYIDADYRYFLEVMKK
jgi:DNA-binding NarL/FixJ family response regulator